ncbi:MAG: YjfB family protein [Fibromonadaceae bacterium]|nr:YjfB family protein [Fibromonadaceae bacterium]
MEMSIAKLATAQKAAEINTAVGVAVLKQAQDTAGAGAMALLQSIPQMPSSTSGMGDVVDIAV